MRIPGIGWSALLATIAVVPAHALTLDLPGEEQRSEANYVCENGTHLAVEFINIGDNSLALAAIDGAGPLVLVNVVAASGARYVGGLYELWEAKGEVSFTRAGDPSMTCRPSGQDGR